MKKIFFFCMAGALALTATACDDDDDKGGGNPPLPNEMTINGKTEAIKTVFYADNPMNPDSEFEDTLYLALMSEEYSEFPNEPPTFFVAIELSESLIGKTVDLARPLDQSHAPIPSLILRAMSSGSETEIIYRESAIDVNNGSSTTVESGSTLKVTRNVDSFTIEISLNLSDGKQISGSWSGKAKLFETE